MMALGLPLIWGLVRHRLSRFALPFIVILVALSVSLGARSLHSGWVDAMRAEVRQELMQEIKDADTSKATALRERVDLSRTRPRMRPETGDNRGYRD